MIHSSKGGLPKSPNVQLKRGSTTEAMSPPEIHLDTENDAIQVMTLHRVIRRFALGFCYLPDDASNNSLFIAFLAAAAAPDTMNDKNKTELSNYVNTLHKATVELKSLIELTRKDILLCIEEHNSQPNNQLCKINTWLIGMKNNLVDMQNSLDPLLDHEKMKAMQLQQLMAYATEAGAEAFKYGQLFMNTANQLTRCLNISLQRYEARMSEMIHSSKGGLPRHANVPLTQGSTTKAMPPCEMDLNTDAIIKLKTSHRVLTRFGKCFFSQPDNDNNFSSAFSSAAHLSAADPSDYITTLYEATHQLHSFIKNTEQEVISLLDDLQGEFEPIYALLQQICTLFVNIKDTLEPLLDTAELKSSSLQNLIENGKEVSCKVAKFGELIAQKSNPLVEFLNQTLIDYEQRKEAKIIPSSNDSFDISSNIFELEFDEEIMGAAKSHPEYKSGASGSMPHSQLTSSKIHLTKSNSSITDPNISRVQHTNPQTFNVTKQKSSARVIKVGDSAALENVGNHEHHLSAMAMACRAGYKKICDIANRDLRTVTMRALSPDDQLLFPLSLDESPVGTKDQSRHSTSITETLVGALSSIQVGLDETLHKSHPIADHQCTRAENNHLRVKGGFSKSIEPEDPYLTGERPFCNGKLEDLPSFPVECDSHLQSVPVNISTAQWIAATQRLIGSCPMPWLPNNGSAAKSACTPSPTYTPSNSVPSTKITVEASGKSLESMAHSCTRQPKI